MIAEMANDAYNAERYYIQAQRADRDNAGYRYRLGLLYLKENKTTEALNQIEEAIRLAPGVELYRKKHRDVMETMRSE
jgi:tetratricopeptide (TPR) repeat protein